MKRILLLSLVMLLLVLPAYAEESPAPTELMETFTTQTDDMGITINVTVPTAAAPAASPAPVLESQDSLARLPYTAYALDEAPAALPAEGEARQITAFLEELFGTYDPKTQTVTEYLADGSSVTYQQYVPGVAGMDIEWLASVGLFALFLFCVMKLVGGLLKL